MARSPRFPKCRKHSSEQAHFTLNGKDHLLGSYNSAESKETYRCLITELVERQGKPAAEDESAPLGVRELTPSALLRAIDRK